MSIKRLSKYSFKYSSQLAAIALLASLAACSSTSPSSTDTNEPSQVTLTTAHSSWIEEHFQTEIVKIGLEKLGYRVEKPKEIEYPALYLSVANGDLDYSVVYYEPGHEQFFENAGGEEKLAGIGTLTPDGIQGYQIDKKTADKYNISNLEQLKNPKIAKLFDSDGDGKANLVGCNPGWACELNIDHQIKAYGLEDTVEHDRGQYAALLADSITRYKQGESVLFFAYNPHWIGSVLVPDRDTIWLEVPYTSLPETIDVTQSDTTVNGKNYGFPKVQQSIVVNKEFLAANPVAKRWFELVQIPVEDINQESLRIKEGESKPEDIRRHAQEWVANNQELFDRWIAEANNN